MPTLKSYTRAVLLAYCGAHLTGACGASGARDPEVRPIDPAALRDTAAGTADALRIKMDACFANMRRIVAGTEPADRIA